MASYCLSPSSRCISLRRREASVRSNKRCTVVVRAMYDVDVETQQTSTPGAAPGRSWKPPPPPPPPPPHGRMTSGPNRRELLFGFMGLGVGAAATAAYYNSAYDLSGESFNNAVESLLEDPQFLSAVEDEVLYNNLTNQEGGQSWQDEDEARLDAALKKLKLRNDLENAQA